MKRKSGIQRKFTTLILVLCLGALLLASACSSYTMLKMRSQSLTIASEDIQKQLSDLASSKADIADSMLQLAENHTLLVAEGMQEILENPEKYLKGFDASNISALPNLTCSGKYNLGEYSVHIRVPDKFLKNVTKDANGTVTYAELDYDVATGGSLTVKEELYLASLLSNEFAQIERFKEDDGTYKGFAASYFCYADSGIDVLGDPLATAMISYDGRTRGWYIGAVDAYDNDTLTDSGVFWTEPVQDGSGRGISMICAVPVIVDGEIVGVAGSGGLLVNFAELVESSNIGSSGFAFMVSRNSGKVIINPNLSDTSVTESEVMIETNLTESTNEKLKQLAQKITNNESGLEIVSIDGKECYAAYSPLTNNDWTMVTVVSLDDELIMNNYNMLNNQIFSAFITFFVIIAALIVIVVVVSAKFSESLTNPIIELKKGVDTISAGNWNYKLDIKTGDEIENLGDAFNNMAASLDGYIKEVQSVTAEKERIGAELDVARNIQASMLPRIFPAFPTRKEFDIYATMNPAKEVGGDFYDFFMLDERHIAIVMADVSGKGVPAALFMVIGKTLIKDHTGAQSNLSDTFSVVNNLLCEANSEGLFITAFEGILDLVTGEFTYVNAGHEMPFIMKAGQTFEPKKIKAGFVLAGMEEMRFKFDSITLEPGDRIFQYTDGVTEATNANNELFGMDRLYETLNKHKDLPADELLPAVKQDVDGFVGEAPQFDDITMLCLDYKERMPE